MEKSLPVVLMLDFMDQADVEQDILKDVATVKALNATHASELHDKVAHLFLELRQTLGFLDL